MMATLLLLLAFASIGFVQMPLAVATTPVTSSSPSSSPSPSSAVMEQQEQETTTTTVISSATNRSFDRIVSLADEIISLANEPGQSPDQIDETILQIGMRDQGIQMLAEEAALLPHIESTFGQSDAATAESATTATTTITTSNGAANSNNSNTGNTISSTEGSQTNVTSETELTVNNNNTSSGLSETANNETSTAAAEGIGLQDINSLFVSISNIAQEIRDMASQQYTTNEEIDNTAHAIIMRSEGIMSLLRDLDTVTQIREVFLATSNRTSSP